MKKLFLTLVISITLQVLVKAQDTYVCHVVLFCNEAGQCVEWEICDIVESIMLKDFKQTFGGSTSSRSGTLTLQGFSRKSEGRSVSIKRDTKLKIPDGKEGGPLAGRSVIPGKYKISRGKLTLKLGDKG